MCAVHPPWQPVSGPRVWSSCPRSRGVCWTRPSISLHLCACIFWVSVCLRQILTPEHPDTTWQGPSWVHRGYLCLPPPVSDTLGGMSKSRQATGCRAGFRQGPYTLSSNVHFNWPLTGHRDVMCMCWIRTKIKTRLVTQSSSRTLIILFPDVPMRQETNSTWIIS